MRTLKASILIALAFSASACGTKNRGFESVHQPVVSRTNYAIDLGAGYDGLSVSDSARLQAWFDSLNVGYGDRVSVDMPVGANSAAARDAVASLAARYGLLLEATAPVTEGEVTPGALRVIVSRAKATVPGCPDWSREAEVNFNNHNASNYGCAVNTNLAAMVADPEDLVLGQSGGAVTDTFTGGKAIKAYRDRKASGGENATGEKTRSSN